MAVSPIKFKRGSSFSISLNIPSSIANGSFYGWTTKAQIRKKDNDLPNGLIADLICRWVDPNATRTLIIENNSTDEWPICDAEFDVLFTSPNGQRVRSNTVPVIIQRGVTHNG